MTVAQRRERERAARRDHILAATERTLRRKGFEQLTVDDVSAEAELGKGTIYLYFHSKDELVLAVATRTQERLLQRFADLETRALNGADHVEQLARAHQAFMLSEHPCLRRFLQSLASNALPFDRETDGWHAYIRHVHELYGYFRRAIGRGINDGSLRPDIPQDDAPLQIWSALLGSLLVSAQSRRLGPAVPAPAAHERLQSSIVDFVIAGLRAPRPATSEQTTRSTHRDSVAEAAQGTS